MTAHPEEREAARLLFPAVRWDEATGFRGGWDAVERAAGRGVGGLIIFGGEAGAVRDLTEEVQRIAPAPLLIASDLERGAGQQFRGATPLPPAAALGWLDDLEVSRRAGEVTAREARALGIGWVLAPVADVDLESANPIVGTRAFSADPERAARHVAAWVRGCADGGALACAKHFPGHGRTAGDSHTGLPQVTAGADSLETDLLPFRAALEAGARGVMAGHVAFPALDPSGSPASRSAPILRDLLRRRMGFGGIVATDAINMAGFTDGASEGDAAVGAVAAGCDALLYPRDAEGTIAALAAAIRQGGLQREQVLAAGERIARAARDTSLGAVGTWGREEDLAWALEVALRSLTIVRGDPRLPRGPLRLLTVDDDLGGPHAPPSRAALRTSLRYAGVEEDDRGAALVAVYADVRAWKGRPGLSDAAVATVAGVLASDPDATVLLFAHPCFVSQIPAARNVLAAWGGEPLMQRAAAAWLTKRSRG